MGQWSKQEIEKAFVDFQAAGERAVQSGDWRAWADIFTEDAVWVEHHYGTFKGRDAIREKIQEVMTTYPGSEMPAFPMDWHIVDEDRGWIVCCVWNQLSDPGDGSLHQAYNFTLLKYAGNGLFSYEEDIYNPASFAEAVMGWEKRKAELAGSGSGSGAGASAG